jgi:hypothetical protein
LARELLELAYWLASVYSGTMRRPGDSWLHLVSWLSKSLEDSTTEDNLGTTYTITLPAMLAKGCRPIAHTFLSSCPSLISLKRLCFRATDELVYVLISNLNCDLHSDITPQSLLRDPQRQHTLRKIQGQLCFNLVSHNGPWL